MGCCQKAYVTAKCGRFSAKVNFSQIRDESVEPAFAQVVDVRANVEIQKIICLAPKLHSQERGVALH